MNDEPNKKTRRKAPLLLIAYGLWALILLSFGGWLALTRADAEISLLEHVTYDVTFADTLFDKQEQPKEVPTGEPEKTPVEEETPQPTPKHDVSLLLSDVGLSTKLSMDALEKLPPEVAFSVSPYADDLKLVLDKAQEQKRLLLIQLPLKEQQDHFVDPGPLGIDPVGNHKDSLSKLITLIPGAQGVYGNLMIDLDPKTQQFTNVLKTANLFWVGTLSEANEKLFKAEGVSCLTPDNALHKSTPFKATLAHLNDYGEDKDATAPFVLSLKADSTAGILKWLEESPVSLKQLTLPAPAPKEIAPQPDVSHDPKPAT